MDEHEAIRGKILALLEGRGDVLEYEVVDRLTTDDGDGSETRECLRQLIRDGVVGRTYTYDEIVPGTGTIGREYYVWTKTPETAARDAKMEALDLEWALSTGGIFSHDAELLRDRGLR